MEPIIQTERLSHIYSVGAPFEHGTLVDVDFTAYRGEYPGIISHTGSGKSTLIQHLNGLLKPTPGRALFEGRDIWESKERTCQTRFQVGLAFQYLEYQFSRETTYRDTAFGPKNMGLDKREVDRRVCKAAQFVGLREDMLEKFPFELSGEQKRRVVIAGVIATEPSVLIPDEPTTGLGPVGVASILNNIHDYHTVKNATITTASHPMEEVARMVNQLVVINDGRIPLSSAPREVFAYEDEPEAMGLGAPAITRMFHRLRVMGVGIDPSVYTTEQARDAVPVRLARVGQQKQSTSGERGVV